MAKSLNCVKKAFTKLWRSRRRTVAAGLLIFLLLVMTGTFLLTKRGTPRTTSQRKATPSLLIFMQPNATNVQTGAVENLLKSLSEIKSFYYVD